jgi:hypothetical protein
MTFLADEGVDRQIVERLRLDGHQVAYVAEMSPGIMDKAEVVAGAIQEHGQELPGAFAVLSPGNIRIRREILA